MYSERLVIKLNGIAHKSVDIIYRSIYSVLSQPPYKNTGAGAASLAVDVVEGNASKSPSINITFDDHLIFLNQRKIQWTKLPDMKELIAWAETKKSNPKEALRLAWSVAWDKKKHDTWKPKPWRKKSLSAVLKQMNELILKAFNEAIEEDFQQAANPQ